MSPAVINACISARRDLARNASLAIGNASRVRVLTAITLGRARDAQSAKVFNELSFPFPRTATPIKMARKTPDEWRAIIAASYQDEPDRPYAPGKWNKDDE